MITRPLFGAFFYGDLAACCRHQKALIRLIRACDKRGFFEMAAIFPLFSQAVADSPAAGERLLVLLIRMGEGRLRSSFGCAGSLMHSVDLLFAALGACGNRRFRTAAWQSCRDRA